MNPGTALRQLSEDDWRSLLIYARNFSGHPGGLDAEDLVHTAIERLLAGERHWDSARVGLTECLAGIIRSIASAEADKERRRGLHEPPAEVELEANTWNVPDYTNQISELRDNLQDAPHLQRLLDGLLADQPIRVIALDLNVSVATVYRYNFSNACHSV